MHINDVSMFGAIAQLVEHLHGMQGVSGSNPLGSTYFFIHTNCFQKEFSNNIIFVRNYPSLFGQFCSIKCTYKILFIAEIKNLTWFDITRKSIKSKLGFCWSVQVIEKQNKVKTKVVNRFPTF